MPDPVFSDSVAPERHRIEEALDLLLPPGDESPAPLHQAMRYAVFAGGKRVRPLLVLLSCRACGGPEDSALPVAAAVELIHTYSLVHDDLPSMDDDLLRRGKPTTHAVYGEALAILVGDALLTRAFEILAGGVRTSLPGDPLPAERRLAILCTLASAVNSRGMIGGQAIDLASQGAELDRADLVSLQARKTGALITACVLAGALVAGRQPEDDGPLRRYGNALGLAFQITDDILDVTGSEERLGKSAGKDRRARKSTFPGLMGVEGSGEEAARLIDVAVRSLEEFDAAAEPLRALARFVGRRDH